MGTPCRQIDTTDRKIQLKILLYIQKSVPEWCLPPACQPYHIVSHVGGVGGGVGGWMRTNLGHAVLDIPTPSSIRHTHPPSDIPTSPVRDLVPEILTPPPPLDRMTDRHLRKHWLPTTIVAGSKYIHIYKKYGVYSARSSTRHILHPHRNSLRLRVSFWWLVLRTWDMTFRLCRNQHCRLKVHSLQWIDYIEISVDDHCHFHHQRRKWKL